MLNANLPDADSLKNILAKAIKAVEVAENLPDSICNLLLQEFNNIDHEPISQKYHGDLVSAFRDSSIIKNLVSLTNKLQGELQIETNGIINCDNDFQEERENHKYDHKLIEFIKENISRWDINLFCLDQVHAFVYGAMADAIMEFSNETTYNEALNAYIVKQQSAI